MAEIYDVNGNLVPSTSASPDKQISDSSGLVINPSKEDGNLASIKAKTDNLLAPGQALMAASSPVVIASNQSAIPITGTVTAAPTVSTVSSGNSTSTPLGVGATFTGAWEDIKDFSAISIYVYANVASSAGGLLIQFSTDGSTVFNSKSHSIAAGGAGESYVQSPEARYFRIAYTNGGTIQATFQIQTIYRPLNIVPMQRQIGEVISADDPGILTRSVISGESTAAPGSFVNAKVSSSGAIYVSGNGSIGVPDPGVSTIQGVAGGVAVPTSTNSGVSSVTAVQGGAPWSQNITQLDGAAISATNPVTVRLSDGVAMIDSVSRGAEKYIGVAAIQDIEDLVGNSSTANLASGASFTGSSESTFKMDAIDIAFIASQDCSLLIQQSIDGTNWDFTDSYVALAGIGSSLTIKTVGEFFRISVTNNGGISTTYLRLECHAMPISQPMPRSLSYLGNLKVSVEENSILTPTFSASATNITPAASPTDIFTITGSASKVVRVTRFVLSATQTTAGSISVLALKRSSANTGGTSATQTTVPHDSANPAATAVVRSYTANPTTGTLVGATRSLKTIVGLTAPGSSAVASPFGTVVFESSKSAQEIVLRGVAEVFAINLNGVTLTGGSFSAYVEWTEDRV